MLSLLSNSFVIYGGIAAVLLFAVYWFFIREEADSSSSTATTEEDHGKFVDDGRPKMLILFGSQTGTAEEYANTLAEEASRNFGFNAVPMDMVDYDPEELTEEKLVVFLIATYGEGEPTDNARDFYDWLRDSTHDKTLLSNVKFTVFGLGNKQYKIYQAMGRYFDKRLPELGAERIFESGEGDADADIEEDYEDWRSRCLPEMARVFDTSVNESEQEVGEPKYELKFENIPQSRTPTPTSPSTSPSSPSSGVPTLTDKPITPPYDVARGSSEPDQKTPYLAPVIVNRALFPVNHVMNPDRRNTIHVEFDLTGSRVKYEAGDHLAILSKNAEPLVTRYLQRLGIDDKKADDLVVSMINKKDLSKGNHFNRKCTLRTVFSYYLDLTSIARKKALKVYAHYARDEAEKQQLQLLAANTEQGKREYHHYVKDECKTPLDILLQYKSIQIPLNHFLETVPRLQPRYYSIASSSTADPTRVAICVAVVRYNAPNGGKQVEGLASSYLERLKLKDRVYLYVRKSNFHLPNDTTRPVIMVGPGTGFAPFAGFLQQRRAQKEKLNKTLGKAILFFGCRHREHDFIYRDELESAHTDVIINDLQLAFSRDQSDKLYVQHRVAEQKNQVWDILNDPKKGILYICGDAKYMAKDVENTIISIVQEKGNTSLKAAQDYVEELSTQGRFLKDVWSA
jgi:NADPH-ferrihemoprotein reductase